MPSPLFDGNFENFHARTYGLNIAPGSSFIEFDGRRQIRFW